MKIRKRFLSLFRSSNIIFNDVSSFLDVTSKLQLWSTTLKIMVPAGNIIFEVTTRLKKITYISGAGITRKSFNRVGSNQKQTVMKKISIIIILVVTCTILHLNAQDNKGLGRVKKMQGKEVYIMSEPVRDYEVVEKVNSAVAQLIGVEPTIENMVKVLVEKAVNKEMKGKIPKFDAIMTDDGETATLIKFK